MVNFWLTISLSLLVRCNLLRFPKVDSSLPRELKKKKKKERNEERTSFVSRVSPAKKPARHKNNLQGNRVRWRIVGADCRTTPQSGISFPAKRQPFLWNYIELDEDSFGNGVDGGGKREKIKIFTREIPYLGKDSSEFFFLNAPGFNPAK